MRSTRASSWPKTPVRPPISNRTRRPTCSAIELTEATAFVDPEILHIGSDRVAQFLKQEPSLAIYRHPLDRILRAAPHTLNDEGEAIVARFGLMDNAGGTAYSILTNADIPWPRSSSPPARR